MTESQTTEDPRTVSGNDAAARASGTYRKLYTADLEGWGRYPIGRARVARSENLEWSSRDAALSRGLGRAYGDAALPAAEKDLVSVTTLADRCLAFDRETGVLRAEAGLSLDALARWTLPRGWFVPVTPGTRFVTLGGMVAADVHGKNHHVAGCIGEHVTGIRLRVADGRVLDVSAEREPELFRATLGGMGLTGHILEVSLRLERIRSPWILQETEAVADFEALVGRLQEESRAWPFTVAWMDAIEGGSRLGRGVLIKGRWADPGEVKEEFRFRERAVEVPVTLPGWFLNRRLVGAFNGLKYTLGARGKRTGVVHPVPFFYPLDAVLSWNRLYGRRGFTQYQCVLPVGGSLNSHRRLLDLVVKAGGAFLCVVKDCGIAGTGLLSFPRPGISFAFDMPIRSGMQQLVDSLNEIVAEQGGGVYLAKDAFTRPEHFRAMEPRLDKWLDVRRRWDPEGKLRSALSERLFGRMS